MEEPLHVIALRAKGSKLCSGENKEYVLVMRAVQVSSKG
jgi:hypothetical protein